MTSRTADTSMDFTLPRFAPAPQRYGARHGGTRIGSLLRWIAETPRRRAVMNELASLNDHELADIGLVRGDLHRVFDADFLTRRVA